MIEKPQQVIKIRKKTLKKNFSHAVSKTMGEKQLGHVMQQSSSKKKQNSRKPQKTGTTTFLDVP